MLSGSIHAGFLVIVCLCLAMACRWAYRVSPVWGAVVAAGMVVRLIAGLSLVAISYFQWPILESLQTGDGFWAVAPDARVYYELAAGASRDWAPIPSGTPSPIYLLVLSIWFRAVGATIASAVLFNAACYTLAAVAIVWMLGSQGRRLGTIVLCSFAFSPALLLTSTQVLKDSFFAMLIVLGCVSLLAVLRYSRDSVSEHPRRLAGALLVAVAVVAAIGGVRAYYAVFVWVAIAIALLVSLVIERGRARLAAFDATVLVLLWCAFAVGADAYYAYYRDLIARMTGVTLSLNVLMSAGGSAVDTGAADPGELGTSLNSVRTGFIRSGGATNLRAGHDGTTGTRAQQVAGDLALGLAVTFVPVSLLKAASVVTFDGGRGLLILTDLDTLFLDATLLAICIAMLQGGALTRHNLAAVLFVLALAAISALVVAYVVTNFGTLFRLRILMAAPAWLAPLAVRMDRARCAE
jgi:hypothetical protein